MLSTAKKLYSLGFAIHLLKPKSKAPIENGWSTRPKKSWSELQKSFRPGMNLGVRLGSVSEMDGTYLGVIDCDVKSKDKKHLEEMEKKLLELIKEPTPTVISGRGQGSKHLYVRSVNPIESHKYCKSKDKVAVFMPSVKARPNDLKALGKEKCAKGFRLRDAWEISIMGERQQVVLPPSIHPDSGRPYIWEPGSEINKISDIALLDLSGVETKKESQKKELKDFKPVMVDLEMSDLSDDMLELIKNGSGVLSTNDRSAEALTIALAMCAYGFSDEEILTLLTDEDYYIGSVGYDHAKTSSRRVAAQWVLNYTLKKARDKTGVSQYFNNEVGILTDENGNLLPGATLSNEKAQAQTKEFLDETDEANKERGFHFIGDRGGKNPDHNALSKYFKNKFNFKTIADMRCVYVFNGTHYENFTPIEIKGFAEKYFNPKPVDKTRNEFLNKVLSNEIRRKNFFGDTTENKINFKNGVLDLDDDLFGLNLIPHSPDYGFRGVLPYNFDPNAKCPLFDTWISDIMLGDTALINILQEYMGYVIRGGDYKYHKALWLGGSGRNGKSTFIDVLKALIGKNNFITMSIKSLVSDKFAGAELDGKLANFSEETSPEELRDSGPFKNLTGDGEISAQKKYGDPYTVRNRAKLIMTYNQIPDVKDLSVGMLSRPIIIPFLKSIPEQEQDRNIKSKLLEELPGIFNFALEGWNRLEKQGFFTKSEKSELALKKVKEESCPVTQWAKHYVQLGDDPNSPLVLTREMYDNYRSKYKNPFTISEFSRRLKTIPKLAKRYKRTESERGYKDVQLIT